MKSAFDFPATPGVVSALALFLAVSVSPFALANAANMSKTHPNHYLRPAEPLDSLMGTPRQRTKQPPPGSNVILHRPNQLRDEWRVSGMLSAACRKGTFRQRREHQLVAILDGRTYGAAIGGHYSLVDRQKLADKRVIYIFKAQGTSTCRVYHRSE